MTFCPGSEGEKKRAKGPPYFRVLVVRKGARCDFAIAIRPLRVRPREKKLFSLERSDAKASNFMFSLREKSHESATDRRKIGVLGVPPNDPPERQGPRGLDPVIDLKSLWRSLRSFPHQRWGPQEHKPRDSMGRAAKPEQSAFSAVLGSDCSPRAKGVCRPEATPGQGTEPAWKWPGMGPDPRIRPQILQFPYLF